MHLVFVDDSQQRDPVRDGLGPLLAVGAVIVRSEAVGPYASGLAKIKSELGIPDEEELKWNAPRGSFLREAADWSLVSSLRGRMLTVAAEHDVPRRSSSWITVGFGVIVAQET